MPLETLGLPPVVADFANKPRGLVLVTGPTGSGKSTTLASLIDVINETREEHIMTIEDPIEFLHQHKRCIVNQRELGSDATSFADALKAALRQDPDVILVGEMRDLETISTAITAAETGHLVFATLHTQDTPQTIDRIIDVFAPGQQGQIRAQLSVALQGIMTQTLLPTADGAGTLRGRRGPGSYAGGSQPDPGRPRATRSTPCSRPAVSSGCRRWTPRWRASCGRARSPAARRVQGPLAPRSSAGCSRRRAPGRCAPPERCPRTSSRRWTSAGVPARGEVDAVSKQDVADQLKQRGLIVVDIANKYRSRELNVELFARVKPTELAVATRQLSTMVTSGMAILRALHGARGPDEVEAAEGDARVRSGAT